MAHQHAQQVIADLYKFDQPHGSWSTPDSAYARAYYEFRIGERDTEPRWDSYLGSARGKRAEILREKIDNALNRR